MRKLKRSSIHIVDSEINFSSKVKKKNLGIHFDRDLSSSSHVNALIRAMYLELRKVSRKCYFIKQIVLPI